MSIETKQYIFNTRGSETKVDLQNYKNRNILWHISHIQPREIEAQGGIKCSEAEFKLFYNGFEIITENCVALAEKKTMCFQVVRSKMQKLEKKEKDKYQNISKDTKFYLYAIDSETVEESLYYFENLSGDKEIVCQFIPVDCIPYCYSEHNFPGSRYSSLTHLEEGNVCTRIMKPYWEKRYDLAKTLFLKTATTSASKYYSVYGFSENSADNSSTKNQEKRAFYLGGDKKKNIKNIIRGMNWNASTDCFVKFIEDKYKENTFVYYPFEDQFIYYPFEDQFEQNRKQLWNQLIMHIEGGRGRRNNGEIF